MRVEGEGGGAGEPVRRMWAVAPPPGRGRARCQHQSIGLPRSQAVTSKSRFQGGRCRVGQGISPLRHPLIAQQSPTMNRAWRPVGWRTSDSSRTCCRLGTSRPTACRSSAERSSGAERCTVSSARVYRQQHASGFRQVFAASAHVTLGTRCKRTLSLKYESPRLIDEGRVHVAANLRRTPAARGLRNDGSEPGREGGSESDTLQPSAGSAVPVDR